MPQVQQRKDKIVEGLTKGVEFLFKKNKIDWIKGTARLTGAGNVDVDISPSGEKETLHARQEIIVATGSPRGVPGIEIDHNRIITSDEAIHSGKCRRRSRSWAAVVAGVRVDLPSLRQPGDGRTAAAARARRGRSRVGRTEKSFKKRGVTCHTGESHAAKATAAGVDVQVQLADGKTQSLSVAYLLTATGRGPVTTGLNAEGVRLQMDRGYIKVDAHYKTSVLISAIGMITLGTPGHPQLAHVSSAEGIIAAERIAGLETRPLNYDQVPGCTYCDPEIGSVGLTEREAKERGHEVRIGTFPFGVLGRAKMAGETEGFVKIVADKTTDALLGVHMIGARSTELVAEAAAALRLESTVAELITTIHAHPTMAEAIGEAAHATHGAAIHS
jgi:dihydrolipoamide dehydrogenase